MLNNKLVRSICVVCCIYFLQINNTTGQYFPETAADTLRLELKQAEKMFLDNNLLVLANHYNILSAQALVEQSRKWDNPVLNTDQNVYANKRFFQHTTDAQGNPQGEIFVQVQQLIKTAGKRRKITDIALTGVSISEWQFRSVMRSLKYELSAKYYTIALLSGNDALYSNNLTQLSKLLDGLEKELKTGNIAKKEYLRVQALVINQQQLLSENAIDLNNAESELKTILGITGNKFILPTEMNTISTTLPDINYQQLVDSAMQNNTDYQSENCQLLLNRQNLRLQKALSVPDVTVGTEYDHASNYAPNYYGLAISFPLPFWDRNQGNIKSAKYKVKAEEALLSQADQKLRNDVMNAYQNFLSNVKLSSSSSNAQFYNDYAQLQNNITESYHNRQISLIEFLDYYKDYQEMKSRHLRQTFNLRMSIAEVNDVTGTNIIH